MAVQLILCDAAAADSGSGKVHLLGAGWSVTSSPTAPQAVVLLMKVPWDRANEPIPLSLTLITDDGSPVRLPGPGGPEQVGVTSTVEVGRPAGLAPGSAIDASFVLSVQPMPLAPGRYEWRLELGEQSVGAPFQVLVRDR